MAAQAQRCRRRRGRPASPRAAPASPRAGPARAAPTSDPELREQRVPSSSVKGSFLNSRSCSRFWFHTARWFCRPSTLTSPAMAAVSRSSCGQHARGPACPCVAAWPKKFTRSRKRSFEGFVGRDVREPALDLEPHRHRIDAHVLAGDAGDEQLGAVLRLDERAEAVRDLEPPLVVDARRMVAAKHRSSSLAPSREGDPVGHASRRRRP
mgnify:CR=1 FL=1